MDYFKILNLYREPFSNSPEPEFFYQSSQHLGCLQQLELAIRLRRGLNVVMGEVGTGKTTLCREIIRRFTDTKEDRNEIETHLLLDPSFSAPLEFLSTVAISFGLTVENGESEWQIKEAIKNHLFQKGVDEKKTVVLIIDEGQKLPEFAREILREFLNYETNEQKLLQIVIFAQNEFGKILKDHQNFADRVNQYYLLRPLSFRETWAMIRFRLERAGRPANAPPLFTLPGIWAVYRATEGYPRRIITLCHQVMLTLIIQNRLRAGFFLVRSAAGRLMPPDSVQAKSRTLTGLAIIFFLFFFALFLWGPAPLNLSHYASRYATRATITQTKEPAPLQMPNASTTETENKEAYSETRNASLTQPESDSAGFAVPKPRMPDLLGSMKIQSGDTVLHLLEAVYADTGTAHIRAIVQANPDIPDINQIRAGETLHFPAISAAPTFFGPGKVRVQIAKSRDLEQAYRLLINLSPNLPPIRMVPLWNQREGFAFLLVLKEKFPDEAAALAAIRQLPPHLGSAAKVMVALATDTVLFAN